MPLSPGNDDNGHVIDYSDEAMSEVWDEIEDAGLPVTHHIGESQPKCPSAVNSVAVAMMVNIDSFREMFSKYIFGGILDRHPRLRVGWFEGGIAWVPPALQDAEHVLASYRHMLAYQPQHDVRHYWDTHMCASFMVDGLGLRPARRDRDRQGDVVVGLPAQRKHIRLFGAIAGRGGGGRRPRGRRPRRRRQRPKVPRHMTSSLTARGAAIDIPDEPDFARMRAEIGARLRAAMAEHGVDALILSMNGYVTYATGASWPLLDAGLSHVERPVAVVLADDEHPHLFMPFRGGASTPPPVPDDHLHGPVYLEFDHGVEHFSRELAALLPPGASVAVDELTGAMRRAAPRIFPGGEPSDAAIVVGAAQLVKTRDELACLRRASRITEQAIVDVQQVLAPGVRQIDLSAVLVRRAFELGATTNMLEAIWQVMPSSREAGVWTTHGDLALPLLPTDRELAAGDVLWTDISITYAGYCSDFGRTWVVGRATHAPAAGSVPAVALHPGGRAQGNQGRRHVGRLGTRGDRRQRWPQALATPLLPGPRHRHLSRRTTHDRNRSRRGVR